MISAAGKRPNDLRAGAVEAAILAFADYLFDGNFGHRGDAWSVSCMVRDLAWLSRLTGRGFPGDRFAGSEIVFRLEMKVCAVGLAFQVKTVLCAHGDDLGAWGAGVLGWPRMRVYSEHCNVCFWGLSRLQFRAAGCLLLAKRRHSVPF